MLGGGACGALAGRSPVIAATEMFFHPEGYFVQHWWPHPSDPEKCIYQVQVYGLPGMTELPSFMGVVVAERRLISSDCKAMAYSLIFSS